MFSDFFCVLLGGAGRAHVEAHYDINKLNDRLVEIYQELLDGKVGSGMERGGY